MSDKLPRMDYRQHRRARRLVHECCDDYRDIQNPKIRARVKYFKEETEGVAAMCKTMQVIVDREREDAEVAKGKRIALNLWKNGEHDLDKIAQTTELSLEQVREAITEPCSA